MTDIGAGPARAAFERDGYECQHCGATRDDDTADGSTALETYAVGSASDERDAGESATDTNAADASALVTVCASCLEVLRGESVAARDESPEALFTVVRDVTRLQGNAVADVANFASSATSLPTAPESGAEPAFAARRRSILVALDVVDAHFAGLTDSTRDDLPADARAALEGFLEVAARLQRQLRAVLERAETVAASLDRCHVCFAALEAGGARCEACGTKRHVVEAWRDESGAVHHGALFASINDSLREASETADELTDRVTVLAEVLVGESSTPD